MNVWERCFLSGCQNEHRCLAPEHCEAAADTATVTPIRPESKLTLKECVDWVDRECAVGQGEVAMRDASGAGETTYDEATISARQDVHSVGVEGLPVTELLLPCPFCKRPPAVNAYEEGPHMSTHTAGRLVVDEDHRPGMAWNRHIYWENSHNALCFMSHSAGKSPETDAANARRLVACWNACEGLETAWLEQAMVDSWMVRMVEQRDAIQKRAEAAESDMAAAEAAERDAARYRWLRVEVRELPKRKGK